MFEIKSVNKIGKIYQVINLASIKNKQNMNIIQTFGKPIEKSFKCNDKYTLYNYLNVKLQTDVLIYTISLFVIDDEMVKMFKIFNCRGFDIYLYTIETYRLYFVDKLIY